MSGTITVGRVRPVYQGEYDPDSSYTKLDVVYRLGSSYIATADDVPKDTPPESESDYWQLFARGVAPEWDPDISYNKGYITVHNGSAWVSLSDDNKDNEPSTSSDHWSMIPSMADASVSADPDTIPQRDSSGRIKSAGHDKNSDDVLTYGDTSDTPEANTIPRYDSDGRLKSASSSGDDDDATLTWGDLSVSASADTPVVRDGSGRIRTEPGGSGKDAMPYEDGVKAEDVYTADEFSSDGTGDGSAPAMFDGDGRMVFNSGGSGGNPLTWDDTSTSDSADSVAVRNSDGRIETTPGGSGREVATMEDLDDLGGGTVSADPDTVAKRDSDGRVFTQQGGDDDNHAVAQGDLGSAAELDAAVAADAETVVERDGSGRVKSQSGGSDTDAVVWNDTGKGKDAIPTNGDLGESYAAMPIGVPFPVWDHLSGVDAPDNSGDFKFIRLTADEDGSGEYNEGLLTNEDVSGSAPLVVATAEIDHSDSPINGEEVHLINTEESFLRARETSGDIQGDQMQKITGKATLRYWPSNDEEESGALKIYWSDLSGVRSGSSGGTPKGVEFDSADSPDARVSDSTDGETRSKNVSATYYMRIA